MGRIHRIFHDGSAVLANQHLAAELVGGASAYTEENIPARWAGRDWFLVDNDIWWSDGEFTPPEMFSVQAPEDLPVNRTLAINMVALRNRHMDAIRVVRNAELAAKDITFMRAVEAGDTSAQATIATEKQVLRDIPATFDITTGVDTPEKLKVKWPTELPARE